MSVHSRLAPRIVIPLYERLSGRRPWTEMCQLRAHQWCSPEELEARALEKLQPLLVHAYTHVPYYRDLFEQAGVEPGDIQAVAHLSRLPLSGKADLRANFPSRVVAQNQPARRRLLGRTSGSAGLPFEFYGDRAASDVWLGSYLFFREWAGLADGGATLYLAAPLHLSAVRARSSRLTRIGRRIVLGERAIHLSGIDLSPARFQTELRRLPANSRYSIWGWPSSIARLAVGLLEAGVELPGYPTAVVAYAETLTAADAVVIERAFRSRVVNHYSSWEVLHLAQTCPDNPEVLHVNSERAILRVVREDGSDGAGGESGRVVITDLANWVMPFINYDIGDWAVAGGLCPCGRGFPTLLSIEGRLGEAIRTPSGTLVSPVALGRFLAHGDRALASIWEFQAVQTATDAVVLRIVPTPRFTPEFGRRLERELADFLGPGLGVRVETVDRIRAEPSGKRLVIKSALPRT